MRVASLIPLTVIVKFEYTLLLNIIDYLPKTSLRMLGCFWVKIKENIFLDTSGGKHDL